MWCGEFWWRADLASALAAQCTWYRIFVIMLGTPGDIHGEIVGTQGLAAWCSVEIELDIVDASCEDPARGVSTLWRRPVVDDVQNRDQVGGHRRWLVGAG